MYFRSALFVILVVLQVFLLVDGRTKTDVLNDFEDTYKAVHQQLDELKGSFRADGHGKLQTMEYLMEKFPDAIDEVVTDFISTLVDKVNNILEGEDKELVQYCNKDVMGYVNTLQVKSTAGANICLLMGYDKVQDANITVRVLTDQIENYHVNLENTKVRCGKYYNVASFQECIARVLYIGSQEDIENFKADIEMALKTLNNQSKELKSFMALCSEQVKNLLEVTVNNYAQMYQECILENEDRDFTDIPDKIKTIKEIANPIKKDEL